MSVQAAEKHKDFILELNLKYFQKKLIFETCLNYFEQFDTAVCTEVETACILKYNFKRKVDPFETKVRQHKLIIVFLFQLKQTLALQCP